MNSFKFKEFTIIQDKSAMKVGTDGVLLGAWSCFLMDSSRSEVRMLDIGTGTGVIALMLAQCFPNAVVDAIEIDHDAAEEAAMNVRNSRWADRINVIESSLAEFEPQHRYDFIVTNPPFYNATLKPDDDTRAAARHEDSLPFKDISRLADNHLSENGLLAVIYPINNEENVMLGVAASSLKILRVCDVCTKVGKPCKRRLLLLGNPSNRHLLLLGKQSDVGVIRETLNILNADGEYSNEYKNLTEKFYLFK